MQLLKRSRVHTCIWWGKAVNTGLEMRHALPVECKCRWDDKTTVLRLKKGGEYVSPSTVMMDRLTEVDDYLWRGTMNELKAKYGEKITDPREIPDAHIVKKTETVSTIKNSNLLDMNKTAHWAYL